MFKFLKDKLKSAVNRFSEEVEDEVEEQVEAKPEETKETKPETEKKPDKKTKKEKETVEEKPEETEKKSEDIEPEDTEEETAEEIKEEKETAEKEDIKTTYEDQEKIEEDLDEEAEEKKPEKKQGFFSKITQSVTKKKLSESRFEELFFEIEVALLESNIAYEVIEKIKQDLKDALVDQSHSMFKTRDIIEDTLKNSLSELLDFEKFDLDGMLEEKKPLVIAFIGVNGTGKTTNLAKLAYKLKGEGKEVVIAACDTFRAAAIQQVEEHANNIGVKLIKHDYGSDAAAVAFDAIDHAKSKGKDIVLIDTAGRNQSNSNLMEELRKIIRVTNPDLKIFVGDSLTGNDAVEQAQQFNDAVGIDAIILSKVDADEKGGASVSISYVTKKPIIFIGNGQEYKDLHPFRKKEFLEKMGF